MFDAHRKLVDTQEQCVNGNESDVTAEKHKVFLISFAHAVVDPWTVMKWSINVSTHNSIQVCCQLHLPMTEIDKETIS